jgi:hypothetical protein
MLHDTLRKFEALAIVYLGGYQVAERWRVWLQSVPSWFGSEKRSPFLLNSNSDRNIWMRDIVVSISVPRRQREHRQMFISRQLVEVLVSKFKYLVPEIQKESNRTIHSHYHLFRSVIFCCTSSLVNVQKEGPSRCLIMLHDGWCRVSCERGVWIRAGATPLRFWSRLTIL